MDFNFFIPPPSDSINMSFGMSGPGKQPVNNLPQLWLNSVKSLQFQDLLVCSGDFIQACTACCFGKETLSKTGKKMYYPSQPDLENFAKKYNTIACPASCSKNMGDKTYNPANTTECDIADTTSTNCQECMRNVSSTDIPGSCISGCYNTSPYPADENDLDLLNELKLALQRGAYICFIVDQDFFINIYPDTKVQLDFVAYQLQAENPDNFMWFNIPPGSGMGIHAKICTAFYWSESRSNKYLFSILGSFNPSFPVSLTCEIAYCITGLFQNRAITEIALFISAFIENANNNHKNQFNSVDWTKQIDILKTFFASYFDFQSLKFNSTGIHTNINFCGPDFCNLDSGKYVSFTEKNVLFYLGAEGFVGTANPAMGTNDNAYAYILPWGIDLMKAAITNGGLYNNKYIKFGYYGNILDCDNNTNQCGTAPWLISNEINGVIAKNKTKTKEDKTQIYVISKPSTGLGMKCDDPNAPDQNKCAIENISENYLPFVKNLGSDDSVLYKFYIKAGFHWKFMFTNNSLFMSTQHPSAYFYVRNAENKKIGSSGYFASHGYDILFINCPNLIDYYNNMYTHFWNDLSYWTNDELKRLNLTPDTFPVLNGSDCISTSSGSCCILNTNKNIVQRRDVPCEIDYPVVKEGVNTMINCIKEDNTPCGIECASPGVCLKQPNCNFDFKAAKEGAVVPLCYSMTKSVTPVPSPNKPSQGINAAIVIILILVILGISGGIIYSIYKFL